jgi:uncharacterized membrane protein YkoI
MKVFKKKWAIPAAALVLTLSIAGGAYAATSGSSADATGSTVAGQAQGDADGKGQGRQCSDETLLTGDVLDKVKAAALANLGAGATVIRAETDADGNGKYEVHATKADGTMVMVYIDESYKVVSVETCGDGGGMGRGHMGGGNSDETALTGDTLTQVTNAALAAAGTGATLMNATTDDDGIAKYEAHVKKADGTCVEIYLDESFKVVKTETDEQGDRGEGMGSGHMGSEDGRCQNGTAGTTGTTAAPSTSTTGSI